MTEPTSLLNVQNAFAEALRGHAREAESMARYVKGDAAQCVQRLAIYRSNAVAAASNALAVAYPVCQALVGSEFFSGLCRWYWQNTPPASGDLAEYGSDFASFLAQFEPAQALPYLSWVAQLEWAVHVLYGQADSVPLSAHVLARWDVQTLGECRVSLQAGLFCLDAPYAAASIWQAHQPPAAGLSPLEWNRPQSSVVYRSELGVQIEAIDACEAFFLRSLQQGATLNQGLNATLEIYPDSNIPALLTGLFGREIVMDLLRL